MNQVFPSARASGGPITIQAGQIDIRDGGEIATRTLGVGNSGAVTVTSDRLRIVDAKPYQSPLLGYASGESVLGSMTFSSASSGNVRIDTRHIDLQAGGRIATFVAPTATGQGGNITVKADQLLATGLSVITTGSSGISSLTTGLGRGGDVTVNADTITLRDGGLITTFAYPHPAPVQWQEATALIHTPDGRSFLVAESSELTSPTTCLKERSNIRDRTASVMPMP